MILFVSAAQNIKDCARAVEKETGERVQVGHQLRACQTMMQTHEYCAVVVDQALLDASAHGTEQIWKHAGEAILITLNFAICDVERVVMEVRAGLLRRERNRKSAAQAAENSLRSELKSAVTGILLSSELALAQPELPIAIADKLKSMHKLALELKTRLGPAA